MEGIQALLLSRVRLQKGVQQLVLKYVQIEKIEFNIINV